MTTTPLRLGPPTPRRTSLSWEGLFRVTVLDLGLACCGVEVMAALHEEGAPAEPAAADPPDPPAGWVLVVSGTVTDVMLPAVLAAYAELPEPRYVLSVGACSNTGGPYWDSYSVTKGIDQLLPVHVAVPGCPPRPDAVLGGLRALQRMLAEDQGPGTTGAANTTSEDTA
ncbi:NADH-quinone oxidoreductase subunit B [Actinoalloteichus spitiensis]|uniref:NADH-quinone oxidoreductase subunit B n=1 Tax=Actinoalloteichus spitiensis TaxID=252394 RepID=UPI00035F64C1|nr:NADH-quinone oxidoreductase subunit NuoB [Actinoalloteichus spitiensis]